MNDIIDVSFGMPLYMKDYWEALRLITGRTTVRQLDEDLAYNHGQPQIELIDSIKELHIHVGNAETTGRHIVVGAGTSQVIAAFGYAAGKLGYHQIELNPPYWGRIATLLNMGYAASGHYGNVVRKSNELNPQTSPSVKFVTNPNNPDFTISEPDPNLSVVDMCYNWPQYLSPVIKGDHDIMFFGLAKATGHAGTRIGWALVKDPGIAEHMRKFIEMSTCGISEDAQARTVTIIHSILDSHFSGVDDCFTYGREILNTRWSQFLNAAQNASDDFVVLNRAGMFAWCQHAIKNSHEYCTKSFELVDGKTVEKYTPCDLSTVMEQTYGLKVHHGDKLGLDISTDCFRINLGCSDEVFEQLIKALTDGNKIKKS